MSTSPRECADAGYDGVAALKDRFAANFVPFAEFETDAAKGDLPDLSFNEPCLILGHGDYHPAVSRALGHDIVIDNVDPPSAVLGGEAFLPRVYNAYKSMPSSTGSNVFNTAFLIGWDEPGGTYDHVAPGPVPPPDADAPVGELGFKFDRSGYRVPAILVSPWIESGSVYNEEYRHTSLIATLREQWGLGDPFTARDAAARSFAHLFTLDTHEIRRRGQRWTRDRCLSTSRMRWASVRPSRCWAEQRSRGFGGTRSKTTSRSRTCPRILDAEVPPEEALNILHNFLAISFPLLAPAGSG